VANVARPAAVDWLNGTVERFAALSTISLVFNLGYFIWIVNKSAEDFDLAPLGQVLVLDHLMFIGVMTNAIFALMAVAAGARRELMPWANTVIAAAVNIGLAGFIVGLLSDVEICFQISTSIMGDGILLGILVFTLRLQSSASPTAAEATS